MLEYLLNQKEGVILEDLVTKLEVSKGIIKTIEKNGYIEIKKEIVRIDLFKDKEIKRDKEFILNDEQQYAFFRVDDYIKKGKFQEFLLYGVTGSRKDRSVFTADKKCFR